MMRTVRGLLRRALATGAMLAAWSALGPGAEAQERVAILTEAGTPMVALEVLLAVGPIDEDPNLAGISYLAARSLIEPLRPVMDEIGATISVHSNKDAIGFTLVAAPDAWIEGSRALLVALFRDPVDSLAVERERRTIRAELEGRAANPADVLLREVDLAFWGEDHPWGRPTVGTVETIQRIRMRDVDTFLREHFVPARTYAVLVGPVDGEEAGSHLSGYLGSQPADTPRFERAQAVESRLDRPYNSITTWISLSYRFGARADLEALRLLAHLTTEGFRFGPRRPSVYNVRADLFARPREGELRFQLVVPPGQADEWAARIDEEIGRFALRLLSEPEFEQSLRSFRGTRTMDLRSPEARAREAARQLFVTGRPTLLEDFDQLTPERLRAAARALAPPVTVLLGPSRVAAAD